MPKTVMLKPSDRDVIDLSALPHLRQMKNPHASREAREVHRQMREINSLEIKIFYCVIFSGESRAYNG